MIQGDHGAVAFRNFKIADLSGKPAVMAPIAYKVFYGKFKEPKDFFRKNQMLLALSIPYRGM
jgi:hypothetical protein